MKLTAVVFTFDIDICTVKNHHWDRASIKYEICVKFDWDNFFVCLKALLKVIKQVVNWPKN